MLTLLILASCSRSEGCEEVIIPDDFELGVVSKYDSVYAHSLGADEYGMHKYVMALLRKGPNREYSEEFGDSLQKAHMDNINRLAEEGLLVLAGPTFDETDLQGVFIFNVETIEEARKLTETDPAIQYGSLVMELHPWYGSAAVMEINKIHAKVSKTNI